MENKETKKSKYNPTVIRFNIKEHTIRILTTEPMPIGKPFDALPFGSCYIGYGITSTGFMVNNIKIYNTTGDDGEYESIELLYSNECTFDYYRFIRCKYLNTIN